MDTGEPNIGRGNLRRIGDIDVEVETCDGALSRLVAAVMDRKPGAWGFCNAHTVNVAASDPAFREAVQSMTMFNDGVGVDIASRWLYGASFPENLNGTDLTPILLSQLPEGTPIFLLGGEAKTVVEACSAYAALYPNIRIAGWHHGYFDPEEGKAVADHIATTDAGLILVGMGHPRQEKWAATYGSRLSAPTLCVGALIDRAAGRVPRAPMWIRQMNAEWLFRLALEPRRLAKRYLWGNLVFLYRVRRQKAALNVKRMQVRA